ncbi:MAG: HEAT repeat domain-containing protein [Planctomycetota bacterium]|nr:HEAT repeat domain-containing protein [Planctomycetota bacterium]
MRIRSLLLPLALALPLVWVGTDAWSCIRFKAPGGSVKPGLREPTDPAPETKEPTDPDSKEPTDPTTPTTPGTPTPTTPNLPGTTPGTTPNAPKVGGTGRKAPAIDNSTWETWWELNRVEFFPHRWVGAVISPENGELTRAGPQHIHPDIVQNKIWPVLMKTKDHKHAFVQEAALITMGRVAANEDQRREARTILLGKLKHRNHLIARSAALGLFYVADESSILPMYRIASNEKTEEDVRAFLALTMTNLKHPMAAGLLKQMADTKKGYYELVGSALMGLGYNGIEEDKTVAEFLYDVAFRRKNTRAKYRALAVESFGRIGDLQVGKDAILKGLADRDTEVRRSAMIAIGVLDYRTNAEREIENIRAPYEEFIGVPMTPEDEARIDTLTKLIPDERKAMVKDVKTIVKKVGEAMKKDGDGFVKRMAAISLGRIHAQHPTGLIDRFLREQVKRDRVGMREYSLLAMAIGGLNGTDDLAYEMLKNRNPSARGAACIALGIYANPDRDGQKVGDGTRMKASAQLQHLIGKDPHPFIRGYAAIGAGMVGAAKSAEPILKMVRTTKTPEARAYGALGLALLGTKQGSKDIVGFIKSKDQMRNGFVASHMVYALGLTKDRSSLDALLAQATDDHDQYVQAAALAGVGYLCTAEFYPRRHIMARGYNYMLNMDYIDTYFFKL